MISNAISIPIAFRYLGPENFGIWTTISSGLTMLLMLDLGIANSLTNFISEAYANQDQERASVYSTTAFVFVTGVALLLGVVAWRIWPILNWSDLFHVSSGDEATLVRRAAAVALIVFLVGLPAGLGSKILAGYQELRWANLFTGIGSVCSLILLIVLVKLHAGLVALVAASSAALVGTNLLSLVWIWRVHKPWLSPRAVHVRATAARKMMQLGGEFFVLQIATLVVFNTDNLIVTHYLGPAQVASYSVAWRLVGYAALVQTLISPVLWPAFAEAFARGDVAWVRQAFWRTMQVSMGLALALCVLFAAYGRWMIRVWAGPAAVPNELLMVLMCLWVIISTFMSNTATVLVAKGETSLQAWCSLAAAVLNIGLSVYWVQRIGTVGVILGTIVSYALIQIIPQSWACLRLLKDNEGTLKAR